jgi:hypothetical protein
VLGAVRMLLRAGGMLAMLGHNGRIWCMRTERTGRESRICQLLVRNLGLLEPGLELIATEYPVAADEGASGRIDILARDAHENFVVIELKVARPPGREAVQEILKYTRLLAKSKRLGPDRVRSFIGAIDWHEIIGAFSKACENEDLNLYGFKLVLSPDGDSLASIRPVEPLASVFGEDVTPVHHVLFFASPQSRDNAWRQIVTKLNEVGAVDLLGFDFVVDSLDTRGNPFALYLVFGAIDPHDQRVQLLQNYAESDCEAPDGAHLELRALTHLCNWMAVHPLTAPFAWMTSHPEKLARIRRAPDWEFQSVRRTGIFVGQSDLVSDQILLENIVARRTGQSIYIGSGSPHNGPAWRHMLGRLVSCLAGNEDWEYPLIGWLEEFAESRTENSVKIALHNPCDFIGTLVYGFPDNLPEELPEFSCWETDKSGLPLKRGLVGHLSWNGQLVPRFVDRVRDIYHEPYAWRMHRNYGTMWEMDIKLLAMLNLQYSVIEYLGEGFINILTSEEGVLNRRPAEVFYGDPDFYGDPESPYWEDVQPIYGFFQAHARQITQVAEIYRHGGF